MRLPLLFVAFALAACSSTALPSSSATDIVAAGRFSGRSGEQVTGGYRIERTAGRLTLVLNNDFQSSEGPDLHLLLSPTDPATVQNATATAGGAALIVAPLGSRHGEQRYRLPDTTTLARYRSVLVHCVRYTHLYGAAPL